MTQPKFRRQFLCPWVLYCPTTLLSFILHDHCRLIINGRHVTSRYVVGVQHISVDWMHVIVYYKLLNIEKKVCLEVETSMWPPLPKKKKVLYCAKPFWHRNVALLFQQRFEWDTCWYYIFSELQHWPEILWGVSLQCSC